MKRAAIVAKMFLDAGELVHYLLNGHVQRALTGHVTAACHLSVENVQNFVDSLQLLQIGLLLRETRHLGAVHVEI